MNALLDGLDCGFFRNPRRLSTVEVVGGAGALINGLGRLMWDKVS